jgi:hypothetical protein
LRRLNQPVILFGETDHQVTAARGRVHRAVQCVSIRVPTLETERGGGALWAGCAVRRMCRGSAGCCSSSP